MSCGLSPERLPVLMGEAIVVCDEALFRSAKNAFELRCCNRGCVASSILSTNDQEHEGQSEEGGGRCHTKDSRSGQSDPEQEGESDELGSVEPHLAPQVDLPLEQLPPLRERLQLARQQLENETPLETFLSRQQIVLMNDGNCLGVIPLSSIAKKSCLSKSLYRATNLSFRHFKELVTATLLAELRKGMKFFS
ncbi:uncharacterized protein PAC_04170 [Phialocephala subalpina]|uniref:Uncharacterized protein n=1 Tax=Phialocephala subalpina TaxID=576137 RepID=A0A1L7WNE3_9HELO|nr:uncharacterized protein PAC_04170 [Phialocephala subalpina]